MKAETEKIGPCKAKVMVKVEADETRKDYEEVVKLFLAQGRVPGFRPGKAPRAIIQQLFHKEITDEIQNRLLRKFYRQAVDDQKLHDVALSDVTDVLFSPETGISFTLIVEVEPEFELPKYKKIPLTTNETKITDEQVEERLLRQRKAFAKFVDEEKPDYVIADGDLVSIDFTATADGKSIEEIAPEAKSISSGKDFWMQMDSEKFIPEVIDGVKGMKAGEQKEIKFKFSKEMPIEALRGKKAAFSVTVKKVRGCTLPNDAELLTQMKAETMDELRVQTRKAMESAAEMAEKRRREEVVIATLLKKTEFDLPESQLDEEINTTLDRMMGEAQYRGMTKADIEQNRAAILEAATNTAKRQLRLRYILDRIAEAEKIEISDADYDAKLTELASEFQVTSDQLKAQIEKNGRTKMLKSQILNEKTMKFIFDQAKVK